MLSPASVSTDAEMMPTLSAAMLRKSETTRDLDVTAVAGGLSSAVGKSSSMTKASSVRLSAYKELEALIAEANPGTQIIDRHYALLSFQEFLSFAPTQDFNLFTQAIVALSANASDLRDRLTAWRALATMLARGEYRKSGATWRMHPSPDGKGRAGSSLVTFQACLPCSMPRLAPNITLRAFFLRAIVQVAKVGTAELREQAAQGLSATRLMKTCLKLASRGFV